MDCIPVYPAFAPLTLEMRKELYPLTDNHPDGACEFPFGSMFLYRQKYAYTVSKLRDGIVILAGKEPEHAASGKTGTFFSVPAGIPSLDELGVLIEQFDMWKTVTASQKSAAEALVQAAGCALEESRNNFDYLYNRGELAELRGKKFHKKKNLVNAFLSECTPQTRPLTAENVPDARVVLDTWVRLKGEAADFEQCQEALALLSQLGLDGTMVYIEERPVAFSLGESMRNGDMYCVHFEKGIDTYRGIFQYVNQAAAQAMPDSVVLINREQDTGDEGLRQAKMTYRPCAFVEKWLVNKPGRL
ncbi:MAG: phosphatidylglycerol lysyltransferase domain-containing protein [Spirochaetaceae bacterium]|jgi:hypothetical protein|nr:phosphatidylglycerol lysyltransferase domain-containing protein [Spirochaetaceae bacterium]